MKHFAGVFVILLTLSLMVVQFPHTLYAAGGDSSETVAAKISVNTADEDMLTQVPGIGPKTAAGIIEYRNKSGKLTDIDQLLNVKGIGEKKLAKLKPYLTL